MMGILPLAAVGLGTALLISPEIFAAQAREAQVDAQEAQAQVAASAVSIASRAGGRAVLQLEMADGAEHAIVFEGGTVRVDGRRVGDYQEGGALEEAWREFLRLQAGSEPAELGAALLAWQLPGLATDDARTAEALRSRIDELLGVDPPEPVAPETVAAPDGARLSIAPGGISFQELSRQLERLREALEGLGEAAEGAGERLALIVHDDFLLQREQLVDGNLALLEGDLALEGTVRGDVLILDGVLRLRPDGLVEGDVLQVGGTVEEEGGRMAGELLSLRPLSPEVAPTTPPAVRERERAERARTVARERRERGFLSRTARNFGRALEGLVATGSAFLGLGILGLILVYFARPQLERVADTTRRSFGRSFAMGFAGQILFLPAVLILTVLVVTILVLPFFVLGVAMAALVGYLAAAHAAGEIFARRRYRYEWLERLRRSNSYYYVLSGLALLLLPFALAALLWVFGDLAGFLRGLFIFVAVVGTWILSTAGFGAVLLTRGGTRPEPGSEEWMTAPAAAEPGGAAGA